MSVTIDQTNSQPTGSANPQSEKHTIRRIVREVLAIAFWSYALVKLFALDVDTYVLLLIAPSFIWLLDYKIIAYFCILSVIALSMPKWQAVWFILYILLYPFILLFAKGPYFIYKQKSWLILFHVINIITSFLRSFRYRLVTLAAFLLSFAVAIVSNSKYVLVPSVVILFVVIIVSYFRVFYDFLRPRPLFGIYKKCFNWVNSGFLPNLQHYDQIKGIAVEVMTENQITIYKANLGMAVLGNRALLSVGKKLKEYQKSSLGIMGGIAAFFMLLVYTTIVFSGINFALFKIDNSYYQLNGFVSYFSWFRYSFYSFLYAGTSEIIPTAAISQVVSMLEVLCGLAILACFAGAMIATFGQAYLSQLDDLITTAETEGKRTEAFIKAQFGLPSIEAAIEELQRLKYDMIAVLLSLGE